MTTQKPKEEKKTIDLGNDFGVAIKKFTDSLKKITDNPDGGVVHLKDYSGKEYMTLTMPPKKDRKPLNLPKLK